MTFIFLQIEREREWYTKFGYEGKMSPKLLILFSTGFHWRIFLLSRATRLCSVFNTGLKNSGPSCLSILLSSTRSKMAMVRLPRGKFSFSGDLGSIPGRVIPKTQKMVLDASLLNTQHYKVRIKGKVEQSREGVAPSPTPWCSSYRKGCLRVTLDYGRQLYFYCYPSLQEQ